MIAIEEIFNLNETTSENASVLTNLITFVGYNFLEEGNFQINPSELIALLTYAILATCAIKGEEDTDYNMSKIVKDFLSIKLE